MKVQLTLGKNDEALIELSEALRLELTNISSYVNRGEIYLKQADFKSASEDLKKAVELDPDQTDPTLLFTDYLIK